MGSPEGEERRQKDEGPTRRVRIPEGLAVGRYEVTVEEFEKFVGDTGREMSGGCSVYNVWEKWKTRADRSWEDPGFEQTKRDPVVCVSWEDAKGYVEWLSGKTGEGYRLLSEAEWEYVARAGTRTRYWWGDEEGRNRANCDGCGSRRDGKETAPAGSFRANVFGLHDVHGNVWEWVEDCWRGNYEGAPTDGSAWVTGAGCSKRVVRGGSWISEPRNLRSANRGRRTAGVRPSSTGFRIARTLTP